MVVDLGEAGGLGIARVMLWSTSSRTYEASTVVQMDWSTVDVLYIGVAVSWSLVLFSTFASRVQFTLNGCCAVVRSYADSCEAMTQGAIDSVDGGDRSTFHAGVP
jgi:hypothetical protein